MSNVKRVQVLGGGGIAAALLAKMSDSLTVTISTRAYPQLSETRKERRQRERSEAKAVKRGVK